jgi:hypothetical protein
MTYGETLYEVWRSNELQAGRDTPPWCSLSAEARLSWIEEGERRRALEARQYDDCNRSAMRSL